MNSLDKLLKALIDDRKINMSNQTPVTGSESLHAFIKNFCVRRGMMPNEAEQVLKMTINSEVLKEIPKDMWNSSVDGLSPDSIAPIMLQMKQCALEWIDRNKPAAFYRPMFAGGTLMLGKVMETPLEILE